MLGKSSVSVVIPTRGDVRTTKIFQSLCAVPQIDDIHFVVGDSPFGRYEGIPRCSHGIIYTQDDDYVTDVQAVVDAYQPGIIVNAMTPQHAERYTGRQTLVGFGAIFDANLIRVFKGWERDQLFRRECDRVFTALVPHQSIFPEIQVLPWATAPNRMYCQPEHGTARAAIDQRIRAVADIAL